jgi:hypothetical protein
MGAEVGAKMIDYGANQEKARLRDKPQTSFTGTVNQDAI